MDVVLRGSGGARRSEQLRHQLVMIYLLWGLLLRLPLQCAAAVRASKLHSDTFRSSFRRIALFLGCSTISMALCAIDSAPASAARIAVDVGHSKNHPGTISAYGVPEFEYNRSLAKRVAAELSTARIDAFTIGDRKDIVELAERTRLAESRGATFLLSIHHDSVQSRYLQSWQASSGMQRYADQFSGFSLFVSRKNPYFAESLRCASAIGESLQRAGFHNSEHHAEPIEGESRDWADQEHGVYFYDDLVVLKTAKQPAVLLEAGVIVNREEALLLKERDQQAKIATAIKNGLMGCEEVGVVLRE